MGCNITEVCSFHLTNLCDVKPPPDPPVGHPLHDKFQAVKHANAVWREYSRSCLGIEISTVLPQASTVLPNITQSVTDITQSVTDGVTEIITTVSSTPSVGATLSSASAALDWIIPVVISIVCIAIIFIIIIIICKTCHNAKDYKFFYEPIVITRSSIGSTHPIELEVHERINYLNNKAEKGEYWSGHQKPEVGDQENLVPPTDNDEIITDTMDRNSDHSEREISDVSVHRKDSITRNGANGCSYRDSPLSYPIIPLPPVPASANAQSDSKSSASDPVYANHQFEKVAQRHREISGADNCAYHKEVDFHKNRSPIDVPVRPIPTPRKHKTVSPSNHL